MDDRVVEERTPAADAIRRAMLDVAVARARLAATRAAATTALASAEAAARTGMDGDELERWRGQAEALATEAVRLERECERLEVELAAFRDAWRRR